MIRNVFVLCTGRSGSETFVRACQHAENFTAAHESRSRLLGKGRLSYPRDHIEADNRLSWFLGRLDQRYGDEAFYVHLLRDEEATARSYARRTFSGGIMKGYYESILMYVGHDKHTEMSDQEWLEIARDYYRTVNANIQLFLRDKPNKMLVHLDRVDEDFTTFWNAINARGDLDSALAEWSIRYNKSAPNREISNVDRLRREMSRIASAITIG